MTKNLGNIDRGLRIIVALMLWLILQTNDLSTAWVLVTGIVSIVLFFTGAFGFCPLYRLFRFSTNKNKPG